jgi:hypothetical protein
MKFAVLASLVASAAAFAPSKTGKASTALKAFEEELGVQEPLGFFDPLGLLEEGVSDVCLCCRRFNEWRVLTLTF